MSYSDSIKVRDKKVFYVDVLFHWYHVLNHSLSDAPLVKLKSTYIPTSARRYLPTNKSVLIIEINKVQAWYLFFASH